MIKHTIIKKDLSRVIILFHGTGGDEFDLLSVGNMLDGNATLIGVRGNVVEGSLNRFFKRKAPGIFDIENLIIETHKVKQSLEVLSTQYDFDLKNATLLGYSNGANMIGSLIYHFRDFVHSAILMHPMNPIKDFNVKDLNRLKMLITAGKNDPICNNLETRQFVDTLRKANGSVELQWYHFGHQLSNDELKGIASWYQKHIR